jgi:hypothetical protein
MKKHQPKASHKGFALKTGSQAGMFQCYENPGCEGYAAMVPPDICSVIGGKSLREFPDGPCIPAQSW